MLREDLFARRDGLFLRHVLEAPRIPGLLRALHDHRRRVGIELVGVDPHPAVLGLLEDEGERVVELLVGAEPDELAQAGVDVGSEHVGELGSHQRVDAVTGDHHVVVVAMFLRGTERALVLQIDAQLPRSLLQQQQHLHPPDTGEAVAARDGAHPLMDDGDVVPVREVATDRSRADRVVALPCCPTRRRTARHPSRTCRRPCCAPAPSPRVTDRATSSRWRSTTRPDHPQTQNSHPRRPTPRCSIPESVCPSADNISSSKFLGGR